MEYLYHRVPSDMSGTVLYPLNKLKELYPEIYAEEVKKYGGREDLMAAEVPTLHCLWNDVLHLTAVSPSVLKANYAKAGVKLRRGGWFKIPASLIEGENSTAFIYRWDTNPDDSYKEYEAFDTSRMESYRTVPEETIDYYKKLAAEGKSPLLFWRVPHVLYKGSIDTAGLEIVYP